MFPVSNSGTGYVVISHSFTMVEEKIIGFSCKCCFPSPIFRFIPQICTYCSLIMQTKNKPKGTHVFTGTIFHRSTGFLWPCENKVLQKFVAF